MEKLGPEFYGGPVGVIWESRTSGLSATAMHRWWTRRLVDAGLPHRPMHEARHTAITEFLRDTGNLKLAQMLAGHAAHRHDREHLRAPGHERFRKRPAPQEPLVKNSPTGNPHLQGEWRRRESNPRNVPAAA
jgi:integrase